MQPKIKSKVVGTDGEIGEISRVIVDPLEKRVSHIVVRSEGREWIVPFDGNAASFTEDQVRLNLSSRSISQLEAFRREDYLSVQEVEIPHLERHLEVMPGEALIPIPPLEKDIERRTFLQRFTNAIGAALAVPFVYPVFKYIIHPMYLPFDNSWIRMGNIGQLREENIPQLIKYQRRVTDGFLEREFTKSHWAVKASPELVQEVYKGRDLEFRDPNGKILWTNPKDSPVTVFSGKCPHLGCAYRWRKHRKYGDVFLCPCHLSIFKPSGDPLDGPSPRSLDILPARVTNRGDIEIIDMEFKAGKEKRIRIV